MATLNGARHLPDQLDSIARQSHRDWRLFVSDDGSTDDTRAILQDFARNHPVTVVAGPGLGGAAANFLSALCHPELPAGPVALADQDDVWLEGKLARALRRLGTEDTTPALYAAESVITDSKLSPMRRSRAGTVQPGFANALVQNLFGGHTAVMNAAALALVRQAGSPAGLVYHDWWLYQLISGAGGRLVLDATPTALYRQHDGNLLGGSGDAAAALRRLAMLIRGDWGRAVRAHARALQDRQHLLTPKAQATLAAFLAAPRFGPGRAQALRAAGIRRSSARGTAAMLVAATLGRT